MSYRTCKYRGMRAMEQRIAELQELYTHVEILSVGIDRFTYAYIA